MKRLDKVCAIWNDLDSAYEKDKAAAIESGCNEFLTKPISPDLLKDTINKYLKNT